MPFNVPGYNYLGPGNKLHNGVPINSLDHKAYKHDLNYQQAKTKEDIYAADSQAISEFSQEGPLGILSAGALGAKTITEQAIGNTIYPNMSQKREADSTFEANKIPKLDPEISKFEEKDASGANPGGQVTAMAIRRPYEFGAVKKYNKTFQLYTAGYKWAKHGNDTTFAPSPALWSTDSVLNITSLAVLDPSNLYMYMTPAQRNQLTAGDYAKSCRIRCTPLGFRLPFSTLDTESTWANSATLVQTVHGIGIESHIPTRLARYESATSKLAEVTGLHDPSADDQIKTLYGSTSLDDIPASWMIPRHWNQYAHFIAHKDEVLDLGPYYEINNLQDVKGASIIDYKYEFKNGMLVAPKTMLDHASANLVVDMRMDVPGVTGKQSHPVPDHATENVGFKPDNGLYDVDIGIEKSHILNVLCDNVQSAKAAPKVYFGVLPIQSNAPLAPTANFADVVVQWCIETELVVDCMNTPVYNNDVHYFSTKFWDPSAKTIKQNRRTYYAGKNVVTN